MFWHSGLGRFVCRVITFNGHVFRGWSRQVGYVPGAPLPMAYCERCGYEF